MTSSKKHISTILMSIAYVLAIFSCIIMCLVTRNSNIAFATTTASNTYYYDNLNVRDQNGREIEYSLAKKFYQALNTINQTGAFKKGVVSYGLGEILTSDQIKAWVEDGNLDIPKAFGAARDSFLMDHPELFYIDMYKLTISAERNSGVYSAVIDTGRQANAYRDHTFKTEAQVNDAITKFDNKVQSIVNQANTKVESMTEGERDKNLAVAVNEIIASTVKYDFATLEDAIENIDNVSVSAMTFSAYGALVLEKAVCAGYSMAYKVVMDKLNIPCVVVSGYSKGKEATNTVGQEIEVKDTEGDVGHSWNYVYLKTASKDSPTTRSIALKGKSFTKNIKATSNESNTTGAWFAFDTTWNSVNKDKNKYTVMDATTASKTLIPDGAISSSKYVLKYPRLSSTSYYLSCNPNNSCEVNDNNFSYSIIVGNSEVGEQTKIYVSYNGKGAFRLLEEDGLRIATRSYVITGNDGEKKWTKWQDIETSARYSEAGNSGLGIYDQDSNDMLIYSYNMELAQFVVLRDIEPTEDVLTPNGQYVLYEKICYANDEFPQENIVYMSEEFENYSYGQYTPAPYINNQKSTPGIETHIIINDGMRESATSNMMADSKAIYIKLVYDEPLYILDPSKPIEVEFTPKNEDAREFCGFAKFPDGKYVHLIADENGEFNTIEFKFKPSLMYAHNQYGYRFNFKNVGSAKIVEKKGSNGQLYSTTSDKAPNSAYFLVSRLYYSCPRVFGDGRLWIDCCAQPTLVDNSDLSADNFKDEQGNTTFNEKERSQMMLVVNKTSSDTENAMLDEIDEKSNININKEDIISHQTYDINLQICGQTKQIPDGSYVKIALGFPSCYGPNDAGVTFKIFHRKHIGGDEYVIEEIPCVVTQFGIVATVTSFSPYMVAVVPKEKAVGKTIYASIDGKGGKLGKEDGKIKTLNIGDTCEYTISADDGYQLHKLTLNGKDIDIASRVSSDNKITFTYEELNSNNEFEMQFIENDAVERYSAGHFVTPVKVYVSVDDQANMFVVDAVENNDNVPNNSKTIFLVIGISIIVIAFIVAVVWFVLYHRKKMSQHN